MGRIRAVLGVRAARWTALVVALAYLLVYEWSIGDVVWSSDLVVLDAPSVELARDWTGQIARARAPFAYESIAAVYLTDSLVILVSPVNLLLGGLLSILLALNAAILIFAVARPAMCRRPSKTGLLSALPGFLLGIACCAPTVLLAFGAAAASLTLGFLAVRPFLYPLALTGMALALFINLRRVRADTSTYGRRGGTRTGRADRPADALPP